MAICDFCNDQCDGIRYSADAVQAAAASGFRPAGPMASGNEVARRLGLTDFDMSSEWLAQVMADSSDWALCETCARSLEEHLAGNPAPVAQLPPLLSPRPRRRWGLFGRR